MPIKRSIQRYSNAVCVTQTQTLSFYLLHSLKLLCKKLKIRIIAEYKNKDYGTLRFIRSLVQSLYLTPHASRPTEQSTTLTSHTLHRPCSINIGT